MFLIARAVIVSIPINEMAMMEKLTFSKNVRRMLGLSLQTWENLMVGSLAFAAFAAAIVGVATYAVVKLQRQEMSASKDEFDRYKLDAGQAIAQAGARAAEANLELERLKAPRTLTDEQQFRMAEKLKAFSGTTFEMVTYPRLIEPALFSATISTLLSRAGWELHPHSGKHFLLENGSGVVVVASTQGSPSADRVARALLELFVSEGVAARLDHNTLRINPIKIDIQIQVGLK